MSSVVFVRKSRSAEVLTDSLALDVSNGRVGATSSKQTLIGKTGVIAGIGWAVPCDIFAELMKENCEDFDQVVNVAEYAWRIVHGEMLSQFPDDRFRVDPYLFFVVLAGWSTEKGEPQSFILDSCSGKGLQPVAVFACGGGDESALDAQLFIRRFQREPDDFDASRDGIALFDQMRAAPSYLGGRMCRTVGGSLNHTVIGPDGLDSRVIHEWPDGVGLSMEVA